MAITRRQLLGVAGALGGLAMPDFTRSTPRFLGRHWPGSHHTENPPRTVLFQDDFSSGNFTKWNSCQWNAGGSIRNDNCQSYDGTSEYSATVANGGTGHEQAARFEIRDGDIPFSGTERTEIGEPPADVVPGDERWITWDMKFDSAFPTPVGDWFIVQQWHGSSGSPPLVVQVETDDSIYLQNQDVGNQWSILVQAVQRDVWQRWEMHVKFSDDPAVGFVELSVDGVQKIPLTLKRTMRIGDTSNYFKNGIYRDPVETTTAIVWHDNVTITAP